MRNRLWLRVAAWVIIFGWPALTALAPAQTAAPVDYQKWLDEENEAPEPQAARAAAAAAFELKMRILEGIREGAPAPAKPVTASFLRFLEFANFEAEEDIAAEQQLKKVYNLKDARLLTETRLVWERGKSERAFHMFRLDGREYLVIVTPGRKPVRNQYRIEVFEQSGDRKTSLLDTEFSLPDKSAAVFGFEDTGLKPYFISLRGMRWSAEPAAVVVGGVVGGVLPSATTRPPRLVKAVDPVYPKEARESGLEGAVIVEATTDTYGRVAEAKVLRSVPGLDQAAVDAVKQWVYEPMIVDGKPQPVTFTVTVQFKLDKKEKPQAAGAVGIEGWKSGVVGGVYVGVEGGVEGGVAGGVAGAMSAQQLKEFEEDAVRAVGDINPPQLVKQVVPVYPEIARQSEVEGVVILEVKADEQGNVINVRTLRSIPLLDQAAVDAVRQWKYEPLIIDGQPRKVLFTVTVRFQLKESRKQKAFEKFAEGAVKIEKDVRPPRFVKHVDPVYPEIARVAGVEGTVILSVRTGPDGKVKDIMVLRSVPLLDQAAIDAVRQWVYEPVIVDGQAVPAVFTQTVRFQLK